MHRQFATHYRKPNTGGQNPASLWAHNTQLNHIPISPNSLPTFHVCHDLIFILLYAHVLHCLLLVLKKKTLEEYLKTLGLTWKKLKEHATAIYNQFANACVVDKLRSAREAANEGTKEGDMVFENAVLFIQDTLISYLGTVIPWKWVNEICS
ncbi:hypothetical protein Moror_16708 [Moniliophthora roreri MCA 2997]|nr:hypothetical protein Moror_16708 [Moniliophthora roreri MCA 2997]